ncbi:hypothetical protein [Paenarthrobacter sp. PH39-S1]|uniref:hypothetical protein n=1 Tax=Paenarthrobacter sp. PH39-S1 TaxID=3046204 RepID=UPI0024B991EB|nr:hypothetical protein [Paenarthrobacter sp. PH39-S1]MDJ0356798.1 hypothetical protein [Paenarthrobacter sp. PH39-S1]
MIGSKLGHVHPDQERGAPSVSTGGIEDGGESLVEVAVGLSKQFKAGSQGRVSVGSVGKDAACNGHGRDRGQCVIQARGGYVRGQGMAQRRRQPGLDLSGYALLGHDDDGERGGRVHQLLRSWSDMSVTAVMVPRTVPVTLDRPVRGR